jgi:hypothetical protein
MGFISDIFSSPKAPPPIDYGRIGQQQQVASEEAVRLGAKLGRPDVSTPYYTTTWSQPTDEATGDVLDADYWVASQQLTPAYETLRGKEKDLQTSLMDLTKGRADLVATGDLDTSGFVTDPDRFQYANLAVDRPAYDTSGASYKLPGYDDLSTYTTGAADTFYNRAVARLNPQFDRAESRLETQLINAGHAPGTPAYNEELRRFRESKNSALSDLASQSVFQGQDLQSNILGNILTGRGQQLGEIGMEYDVAQRRRQQQISEGQQQVGLDREARDRQIAEAIRLRQLPMNELAALMTGTTPFSQAAITGGPRIAPTGSPAPVDLGALAGMGQADALARYQGQVAQQGAGLGFLGTLGAGALRRPG